MIGYNEIYELLRKEKYGESLQQLPKNFLMEFSEYLKEMKQDSFQEGDLFADSVSKSKKQFENSIGIFKELLLRRKKKVLNLAFVATETGIMKRDYENMLDFEKIIFDKVVKIFEDSNKDISKIMTGVSHKEDANKMIMFTQSVEQFVDFTGESIGPFNAGELVNVDSKVAEVLVTGGKAEYVDEN